MEEWEPISLNELFDEIQKTEKDLDGELKNFWDLIKIDPIKWEEKEYGEMGEGFWVVAICGNKVIWFNDIEEGFNDKILVNSLNEFNQNFKPIN